MAYDKRTVFADKLVLPRALKCSTAACSSASRLTSLMKTPTATSRPTLTSWSTGRYGRGEATIEHTPTVCTGRSTKYLHLGA